MGKRTPLTQWSGDVLLLGMMFDAESFSNWVVVLPDDDGRVASACCLRSKVICDEEVMRSNAMVNPIKAHRRWLRLRLVDDLLLLLAIQTDRK